MSHDRYNTFGFGFGQNRLLNIQLSFGFGRKSFAYFRKLFGFGRNLKITFGRSLDFSFSHYFIVRMKCNKIQRYTRSTELVKHTIGSLSLSPSALSRPRHDGWPHHERSHYILFCHLSCRAAASVIDLSTIEYC